MNPPLMAQRDPTSYSVRFTRRIPLILQPSLHQNTCLLNPKPVFLMPLLNRIGAQVIIHSFLALGPAHPGWLTGPLDTHQLLSYRQLGIDAGRERMYQLRPRFVPHPQHGAAVATEGTLRNAFLLCGRATIFDCSIFSVW